MVSFTCHNLFSSRPPSFTANAVSILYIVLRGCLGQDIGRGTQNNAALGSFPGQAWTM